MEYLFYILFAIVALLYEANNLVNSKEIVRLSNKYSEDKDSLTDDENNAVRFKGCVGIIYLILLVIGLTTSQWILFLSILILSVLMIILKPAKRKLYGLIKFDAIITIVLIVLILLNKFHSILY